MSKIKSIGIFFKGGLQPLHPRILLQKELLEEIGYAVTLISGEQTGKSSNLRSKIGELLSFSLFQYRLIDQMKAKLKSFDKVIIYDSHLLPLSKYRSKNQQIVFETLDDNIELIAYHIKKKLPVGKLISSIARAVLKSRENRLIMNYVDRVIVNSEHLSRIYYKHCPVINFYASPLERITLNFDAKLPPALLYLGKISLDKGFNDILALGEKFNLPIFFFGNVDKLDGAYIHNLLENNLNVHWQDKLSFVDLSNELTSLSAKHRLIGTSLIHGTHSSYQFQDANKDIDYLALGIPFIGNRRRTTYKIIQNLDGFLVDEKDLSAKIKDEKAYLSISAEAKKYYSAVYHSSIFKNNLLKSLE